MGDVIIMERKVLEQVVQTAVENALKKLKLDDRDKKTIFDIDEAVAFTGYKKNTIYDKTSNKEMPHYKKGRHLYFIKEELEKWMLEEGKIKTMKEIEADAINYTLGSPPKI